MSLSSDAVAPLAGRRVLVLRAPEQAAALSARIRAVGGEPVEAPVLRLEPGDTRALDAAVRTGEAGGFTLLALTSPNGVDALGEAHTRTGIDPGWCQHVQVACVGPGTAARLTEQLGIVADLVSAKATVEALAQAIPAGQGAALLPRADRANPVLDAVLTDKGYTPHAVVAYRTVHQPALPPGVIDALGAGQIALVAVASPSTVDAFVALAGPLTQTPAVVSIGPVTSARCRAHGLAVAAEADPHDLDGLLAALVEAAAALPR